MTTQLAFDFPHRPAFGAEDFLVTPSNEAAVAWLDRWPDWPGCGLILHGPAGCGKTHLAHVWQGRSAASLIAAAQLTVAGIPALVESAPALVIEAAETAGERPLLHLLNLAAERRRHLLLTARLRPLLWPARLPDLRSRLLAMDAVGVEPPDDGLLAAVLIKQFADRQLAVGEEVIVFLLRHMERSLATARAAVAAIDRAALAAQRRVTVALVRAVLERSLLQQAPDDSRTTSTP
jgi:chromosomal replication initiation ATPase DnaA